MKKTVTHTQQRDEGVIDASVMKGSFVLQVGASRGAGTALLMARSGLRNGHFIDPQHVDAENLMQTVFLEEHLGLPKAVVLAALCRRIQPTGLFGSSIGRAEELDYLPTVVKSADLVMIGVDNPAAQFELANRAQNLGRDVIVKGMTGNGQQWFVAGALHDGPPLKEVLPEAWEAIRGGFTPPPFYPSCALNAESMNVAAARIAIGLLHHRAQSTVTAMAEVGAGFAAAPLAIGYNGYHAPSGSFMPATFLPQ